MACATGKTFRSLRIAEDLVGIGSRVLFLAPVHLPAVAVATEVALEAEAPLRPFAVCSDVKVGKRSKAQSDEDISIVDLLIPATTNVDRLHAQLADTAAGVREGAQAGLPARQQAALQPGGTFEGIEAELKCPNCACTLWAHDAVIGLTDAIVDRVMHGVVPGVLCCELCGHDMRGLLGPPAALTQCIARTRGPSQLGRASRFCEESSLRLRRHQGGGGEN